MMFKIKVFLQQGEVCQLESSSHKSVLFYRLLQHIATGNCCFRQFTKKGQFVAKTPAEQTTVTNYIILANLVGCYGLWFALKFNQAAISYW